MPLYIETIPKLVYLFVAPVKVSVAQAGQIGPPRIEGEATVIEKHTFARVISEEVEGTDLTDHYVSASPPAEVAALPGADVEKRRERQIKRVAGVAAALLIAAAIGVFLYTN